MTLEAVAIAVALHAGLHASSAVRTLQHTEHLADGPCKPAPRVDDAARDNANNLPAALRVRSFQNVRHPHVIAEILDGQHVRHEDILHGDRFAHPHLRGLLSRSHCWPRLASDTGKFVALLRRYVDICGARNVAGDHGIARTSDDTAQSDRRLHRGAHALGAHRRRHLVAGLAALAPKLSNIGCAVPTRTEIGMPGRANKQQIGGKPSQRRGAVEGASPFILTGQSVAGAEPFPRRVA